MKKVERKFALVLAALMLLTLTACKNWMSGGLFDSIEQEVKVATADKIQVYVSTAASVMGKTFPDGSSTQKTDVPFKVRIDRIEPSFAFYKWYAFSTRDLEEVELNGLGKKFPFYTQNPNRNFVLDDSFEARYKSYYERLSDAVEIQDADKEEATVIIKEVRDDIVIVPVCAARAVLNSDDTYPAALAYMLDQRAVRNQRVVLAFDKNMDFSTFVTCTNSSGVFEKDTSGNNIYYIEKENGELEYYYDWDRSKIQISVYDTNKNLLSDDESYSFFKLPVQNENDRRQIFITPDTLNKKLPKFAKIRITIAEEVTDSFGYKLESDIAYTYLVGASDDEGNPIFKLLSCGRPREGLEDDENTWSDYDGFKDSEGDLTTVLPEDSTDISSWTSDLVEQTFAHRITDKVDILVQITDMVKEGVESTTASDNEIDHFAVRARHLINIDGTPGTGKLYENIAEKNYDALIYHGGAKNFEDGEPGENCNDPDTGYAFPYYLPKDIPDGLIKLEFFAVDITGNSGESTPYAIYVVKDTSAPDIASQANKIKSASVNTLNAWFNDRTIEALSFKADESNKFVDTVNVGTEENPVIHEVAPLFMSDGTNAKLFWNFGNSPSDMAGAQEIKYGTDGIYKMTNLVHFIKEQGVQGAMTFYAQISDDMGNVSDVVKIPLDIYYDNQAPENAGILAPGSKSGIYPETGIDTGSVSDESKKYYTRDTSLTLTLTSVDKDSLTGTESAEETATSSGLAGFLVSETKYADAQTEALKVENRVHVSPDFKKAAGGKTDFQFATGSANDTGKNYFLYAVDYALNPSPVPAQITVIQDTTGPGVEFKDNASYSYKNETTYFKELDDKADGSDDSNIALGTAGSENLSGEVKGVSKGKYYYNLLQSSFPIDVTIRNQHAGLDSGFYYFEVQNETTSEKTSYGLNAARATERTESVLLSEGNYKVIAYDNLGNKTVTETFSIVQDKKEPATGNFSIWGTRIVPVGENGYNKETTNTRIVDLEFDADDTIAKDSSNTGIRKLILKGASFKQNNLVVKAGENVLVKNTDYLLQAAASEYDETYITFIKPRTEISYRIENVMLPEEDGKKYINLKAVDASGNTNSDWTSAFIDSDSQAPAVSSVSVLAPKSMLDNSGNRTYTNSDVVSVEIKAHDKTSGIKQIYITDTASDVPNISAGVIGNNSEPAGTKLILNNAVITVNGTERPCTYVNGMLVLDTAIDTDEDVTIIVSKVRIPDNTKQGEQTVHVILFDNTGLRNESSKAASTVYDTTGPAIEVEDYASSMFDGVTLKKYRSNDTSDNISAVTGTTGRVNGLVTGDYFYSIDDGNRAENPGFRFTVSLKDENITNNLLVSNGKNSGVYKYYIDTVSGGTTVKGTAAYDSGSDVYLTEGTYRIRALDKLGNETVSNIIHIKKDNGKPVNVSDLVITGKLRDGVTSSTTATTERNVKVNFSAGDDESGKLNTGISKITLSGDAVFTDSSLYVVTENNGTRTVAPLVKKTAGITNWDYALIAGSGTADFIFREPVTSRRSYEVQNVRLTENDARKNLSVTVTDFAGNKNASDGTAAIFKDETAPVTSNVIVISTDEDQLDVNKSRTRVTNDEKVSIQFQVYDLLSGIKKITICDANGNSLLTAGEGGSVLSAKYNGNDVTLANTISSEAVVFADAGNQISESSAKPFTITVTNVSMPKVSGNILQGKNCFYVKAFDDVQNVAGTATQGSIIYDNVPPVPKVNMHAPSHFNPYEAYRGDPKNSPQYFVNNVFWKNTALYYFELSGNDNNGLSSDAVAGFWQGKYQEGLGTEYIASGLQSVSSSSTESSYNFYVYDAIGNKSVPSTATNTKVTIKKDTSAPIVTFDGFYANGTKLIKDAGFSSSSDTNSATHYYYTNSDTVDLKFKAHDTGVGISYFDISGAINASFKNGSFTETDVNAKIAEFLSKSTELQVWIDGNQYFRGGYKRSTGEYSDGPDGYGDKAYWDGETQKWYKDSAKTQETQNVYFNCYKDMENGQDEGTRGFRDFGLYNSIPASSSDSVFELRNIDLSCLNQSYLQLNVYVYDHMNNSSGISNKQLIYDANKPEVVKTSFISSGDVNFTSSDVLTTHDLVVEFKENYNSSNDYSYSGIKEIELELTSNVPSSIDSNLKMDGFTSTEPADSFKVYLASSTPTSLTSSNSEISSSYRATVTSVDTVNHTAKLKITLNPSKSAGSYGLSYASGTTSRYLVIHGLTIAGGEADQLETIKVTLKDRAGNISDNTGNTNNVVQIGYDKVAPEMYRTEYCDDSGNLVLVDGVPAVSYFKTVLGNPAVLSTHTQSLPYKDGAAKARKISVFPNPGKVDMEASTDALTGWYAGDDTELVLRFNKNGSGIKSVTFSAPSGCDYRGIFFNSNTIDVTIDNLDGKGPQHLVRNTDYVLEDRYQEFNQIFRTLRFTNSSKCPRGNNAGVYIKGICLDGTEAAEKGVYGLWCSNAAVTSFAGATTYYDGGSGSDHEPGWIICAAMDYDTPEFVNQKVKFTDSSVVSGSTYTDGKTIDLTGRVQSKSLGANNAGTYSSGVWAIHLDNAKFVTTETEKSELSLTVTKTSETYFGETEANALVDDKLSGETKVTYKYESGKDFSKRFMPGLTVASSEIAEFNRNIKAASNARYSVSDDGHTMYLNMPIDPLQNYNFTITNLQLDPAPMADGPVNITATLYKYSGLSNDSKNRIYVRGTDKNPAASGKTYAVLRRTEVAEGTGRDSVVFAQNRTNSITLDTVDPVITWKDASDKDRNNWRFVPEDDKGHTVYYAGRETYSYINFVLNDASGIKGFVFTDSETAPVSPASYSIANAQKYDVFYFNTTDESTGVKKFIHVMDNTGHTATRPVSYLASEDSVPTTWKLDNTRPSVRTVTRHYYGDTAASKYVLKLDSSTSELKVYKGVSDDISGKFTDSYIEFDSATKEYKIKTGTVNDFFEDSGSGLYGTCPTGQNSAALFENIYTDGNENPDFTWKTTDSYFKIMDKVGFGCNNAIKISSYVDSTAPVLSIASITAPDGKNIYRPSSSLSTDSNSPSVIYLNSVSDTDGVKIVFSAADSGENATGVYKVTVGGAGLASGAEGASTKLENITSLSTTATTVTWNLGKGEAKADGSENGLLRSITITDWVGNATTYWFKLVSDVSAPAVNITSDTPFKESSENSVYMTSVDEETQKLNLYFSPFISDKNNGSGSVTVPVNTVTTGLSDSVSGLFADKWYSNSACSTEVSSITLTQSYQNGRAQNPSANPAKLYAKDRVGNLLEFDISSRVNLVYYSSTFSISIPHANGWYASSATDGKIPLLPNTTLFLNETTKRTTFVVGDAHGVKYLLKEGNSNRISGTLGWSNNGVYTDTFEYSLKAGTTYTVELSNVWDQNLPKANFVVQTVLDNSVPVISGTYVSAHDWEDSAGKRYYAAADNGTVYINETGSVTISLSNDLLTDTGSGVKGWYLNPTDKALSITLDKNKLEQNVFIVDNAGNYEGHSFSAVLDKEAPVYTKQSGSDLFAVHGYSAEEPYKVTAANKVIFTGSSLELSLPEISDTGSGLKGTWSVKSGNAVINAATKKITFTGTETVILKLTDNVNNVTEVTVESLKVGASPDISLVKADSDIESGSFGTASYTVYTKEDSAVFTVTKTNEQTGFTNFTCGETEITGSSLSLGEGEYVIKASDEFGRERAYSLKVVVDKSAPSFTGNMISGQHFWTEAEPYFASAEGNSIVVNAKLASGAGISFTLPQAGDGTGAGVDGWYESSEENGTYTRIAGSVVSVTGEKWLCLKDNLGNSTVPFCLASVEDSKPVLSSGYEGSGSVDNGTNTYATGKSVFTTWYSGKSYQSLWNGSQNFKAAGTGGGDEANTSHNNLIAAVVTETGSGIYKLVLRTEANPKVNWIGYMEPQRDNGNIRYNDTTVIAGAQSTQAKYNPMNSVQLGSSSYIRGWSVNTSDVQNADGTYTTVITLPLNPNIVTPTNSLKAQIDAAAGTDLGHPLRLSNNQYIFVFGKNIGSSLEVIDFAGNSSSDSLAAAPVNASVLSRFAETISGMTAKIPGLVEGVIHRSFALNDRKEVRTERKERKTENTLSSEVPSAVMTPEKTGKAVKKVLQNVGERAAEIEASNNYSGINETEEILPVIAKVLPEISKEEESEEMTLEAGVSGNVVNSEKIIANNTEEMYNYSNIAKSVVISIICLLLLICIMFVIVKVTKKQNEKKIADSESAKKNSSHGWL